MQNEPITTFCGDNPNTAALFVYSIIIMLSVAFFIQMLMKWIIYKDYFPLKERSPLLCCFLLFVLMATLNLYPVYVVYSFYFPVAQHNKIFNAFYFGIRYIPHIIYVMRSIRITYAYNVRSSMRKSRVFSFFKHQRNLLALVIAIWLIKTAPAILFSHVHISPINTSQLIDQNTQIAYFIKKVIQQLSWHIILFYCLWMQRKIEQQFGIIRQITAILLLSISITTIEIIYTIYGVYFQQFSVNQIIVSIQCLFDKYPINQFEVMAESLLMIIISCFIPLFRIRQYHTLLPIHQPYDLDNNLRTFLLEPLCYKIFYKYLSSYSERESADSQIQYLSLMKFWTKITKLKLDESAEADQILTFFDEIDPDMLGMNVAKSLKASVDMLNQSIISVQKQKLKSSINDAIEEIENNVIAQISIIYRDKFRKTYAYTGLKKIMQENDRINTNLLMLNMILREQLQTL